MDHRRSETSLKLILTSDTHLGITKYSVLEKMFTEISEKEFDLLIHAGDYSGGVEGWRKVKHTVELMRKCIPSKPILTTIGNHDFWVRGRRKKNEVDYLSRTYGTPTLHAYLLNYDKIAKVFKENGIHFLDEDGMYSLPEQPTTKFIGCSGWYSDPNPPTNDKYFLPLGELDSTAATLSLRADFIINEQIRQLDANYEEGYRTIFVSHFPVINTGDDYKGSFEQFSWVTQIPSVLHTEYNCTHFLCGHAHQRHEGPLRWEAGSDYYRPKYLEITI